MCVCVLCESRSVSGDPAFERVESSVGNWWVRMFEDLGGLIAEELAGERLSIVATCDKFATSAVWIVEISDPLLFNFRRLLLQVVRY